MSFNEFSFLLGNLSPIVLIIGVALGLFLYKRLDTVHVSILYYMLAMLCVDLISRFFWRYGNNHIVLLAYSLIEVIGISYFYYKLLLTKKYILTFVINAFVIIYIAWELFSYLFFGTDVQHFQPYAKVVDNFMIILLALSFLYEKMNSYKESRWDNFRLNIAVLIFFTLNTLIFLPFNFLVNEKSGIKYYFWTGNVILLLLFYGFLTWLIWQNGRQNKLLSHNSNKKMK